MPELEADPTNPDSEGAADLGPTGSGAAAAATATPVAPGPVVAEPASLTEPAQVPGVGSVDAAPEGGEPAPLPAPVPGTARIVPLDVLRGFAVLGIFLMNVQAFSMPFAAYSNPTLWGSLEGAHGWVWVLSHVFAEQKFMTIFSLLFGAGVVLFTERVAARGRPTAALHYRRSLGLIAIGLAHAYLLWFGDILVTYGICALWLYFLRRVRPSRLAITGVVLMLVPMALTLAIHFMLPSMPAEMRQGMEAMWNPPAEQLQAETDAYRGGWLEQMEARLPAALMLQTMALVWMVIWRAGGLMLLGMALFKWGVLSGERSARFYDRMALTGLALGLPLVVYGLWVHLSTDFDVETAFATSLFNYAGSVPVALGYIGLVIGAVVRRPAADGWLSRALAATGRMALTNYLLQTVLATSLFYGHGLGLFGELDRVEQMAVVLAVWVLQLAWSPWWLARYRFGPAEWLWRTMTYLRPQPMRRRAEVATDPAGQRSA
ncbi:MAG TPA: DUF418 domain-containing protein [Thermoanaerobaculia bacterium]|nr:DUF418 domain-containing protein [Thermoanaerobaculia bacterium]